MKRLHWPRAALAMVALAGGLALAVLTDEVAAGVGLMTAVVGFTTSASIWRDE